MEEMLGEDTSVTYSAFLECALALTGEREDRKQVCMCVCMYVYVYVCMYVRMYAFDGEGGDRKQVCV